MLTVYVCLVVIARIVYFPMRLVEGRIGMAILLSETGYHRENRSCGSGIPAPD